jgi:hypothetical protein
MQRAALAPCREPQLIEKRVKPLGAPERARGRGAALGRTAPAAGSQARGSVGGTSLGSRGKAGSAMRKSSASARSGACFSSRFLAYSSSASLNSALASRS